MSHSWLNHMLWFSLKILPASSLQVVTLGLKRFLAIGFQCPVKILELFRIFINSNCSIFFHPLPLLPPMRSSTHLFSKYSSMTCLFLNP